jgi:hypothetical protein
METVWQAIGLTQCVPLLTPEVRPVPLDNAAYRPTPALVSEEAAV